MIEVHAAVERLLRRSVPVSTIESSLGRASLVDHQRWNEYAAASISDQAPAEGLGAGYAGREASNVVQLLAAI